MKLRTGYISVSPENQDEYISDAQKRLFLEYPKLQTQTVKKMIEND